MALADRYLSASQVYTRSLLVSLYSAKSLGGEFSCDISYHPRSNVMGGSYEASGVNILITNAKNREKGVAILHR
jgi:hypothetical protein